MKYITRAVPVCTARRLRWLLALPAFILIGCSTEKPGDAPPPVAGPGGLPKTAGEKTKIAAIGLQEDQFYKLIEIGMKDTAAKQGIDLVLGNSSASLDKEISLVDTFAAQKVAALVVAPQNTKASIPAIQRAHEAGIKVVTYDAHVDADFPEADVRSDMVGLGRSTGEEAREYIQSKMGGKAKLAIISYMAQAAETAGQRTKGFKDEMAKLPGVQIVMEQDASLAAQAVTVVESILTAHPEVNVIWSANEGGTVGALTAVKNAGKAGKIVVFGTDISEQLADFLLSPDNILQAVTGQKPFDIGGMAVETAAKLVRGEKVEKKVVVPGILFTRRKPDEVQKQKAYLHGLAK